MNILVSACLLGMECRYSGKGGLSESVTDLMDRFTLVPVCPEIYGGLQTPRLPAEQKDGRVVASDGSDLTDAFLHGAEETLKLAVLYGCKYAILKERSPSCGHGTVYDGTFSNRLIAGSGVTAELLEENGIRVFGESQISLLIKEIECSK